MPAEKQTPKKANFLRRILPRWVSESLFRSEKVYILPTRAVITLGLILLAMWYAAVSQNNAMAYLLLFFLSSLAVLSMNYTHFNLVGLRLNVLRVAPVFAGSLAEVPIELVNPTRRERRTLDVALDPADPWFIASIPSRGGTAQASVKFPTSIRGEHPLPRLLLRSIYPLGLFEGRQYRTPADAVVLVYPAPRGTLPLPRGESLSRVELAAAGPGGDDYAGSRPYRVGESQRHVDWRAVARGQPLLLKQFVGTGGQRVWLNWADVSGLPDVEAKLSQLCRWIVEAEREGFQYGLRLPGFEVSPSRGDRHRHHLLRALALFQSPSTPNLQPSTLDPRPSTSA
jgi:uncharacterized protein (DUF58 family)